MSITELYTIMVYEKSIKVLKHTHTHNNTTRKLHAANLTYNTQTVSQNNK